MVIPNCVVEIIGRLREQSPFFVANKEAKDMKSKRIRRMVGIRKGGVAVIAVQYEDGEVMQYIFDREGRVA